MLGAGCSESPWEERETTTDASFRDLFFLDARHGWIVGGGHGVHGGILGETRDGGETWSFRTGIVAKPQTRLFSLNAVHFRDSQHGLIAASGGRLLRTIDGGAHWHGLLRAGRRLSSLFFLDERTGWAAGEQWVMRTRDGGDHWERMNPKGRGSANFRARAIFFLDADRGWLVGHHGLVRRSSDAGRTWEPVADMPKLGSVVLSALHFPTPERGWIVGEEGCILHTSDGGRSWQPQASPVPADLRDVHFIDANEGWAVGYDAKSGSSSVLHTRDGGASWAVQATIWGESLHALHFVTKQRAWAVGERVRRLPQRLLRYTSPAP